MRDRDSERQRCSEGRQSGEKKKKARRRETWNAAAEARRMRYVMTQSETEALASFLQNAGLKVAAYHGSLSLAEREEAQGAAGNVV